MSNLKDRARSNGNAPGTDVATSTGGRGTVAALIEAQKGEIARALPKHMDPDRLARIALTVIKQTPALQRCDTTSLLGALMTCSQLGLEPGPLGEAYLVPYGDKVTFIPGYRGLIKLAWQSGRLLSISADVVHANDDFDYEYGLTPKLRHKPTLTDRGDVIAVYACATFKDGGNAFVVLSRSDVEAIRNRSRAGKSGPWVTDWDAMARKTAVRQLARWLPMSTELQAFQTAAAMDDSVRSDYTAPVEAAQPAWISAEVVEDSHTVDTATGEIQVEDPPADALPIEPEGWR
jgi:recombination protein RecT